MRVTNKIIQNNSITNINNNKVMEDKLNTQLATGKKINRPSDDPVVAIRSLRLRTSLTEIEQYYKKNVPDADNWLKITENSVDTTISLIKSMYSDCTSGSEGFKTADDRNAILGDLKGLRDEIFSAGNSEYAGRYVFTGYRTGVPLTFSNGTSKQYTITEQLDKSCLSDLTYMIPISFQMLQAPTHLQSVFRKRTLQAIPYIASVFHTATVIIPLPRLNIMIPTDRR